MPETGHTCSSWRRQDPSAGVPRSVDGHSPRSALPTSRRSRGPPGALSSFTSSFEPPLEQVSLGDDYPPLRCTCRQAGTRKPPDNRGAPTVEPGCLGNRRSAVCRPVPAPSGAAEEPPQPASWPAPASRPAEPEEVPLSAPAAPAPREPSAHPRPLHRGAHGRASAFFRACQGGTKG